MKESVWKALDDMDNTITKLLALRDVLSVHQISHDELVKILDSYVEEFSKKHRVVFDEFRSLYAKNEQSDCISGEVLNIQKGD